MALSATMPLHVQGFIHACLRFPPKCRLLKRSIDRPNICYVIREMIHPARSFKDLSFLIPPDIRSSSEIIKTMVFLDGLSEACNLASTLIELIPKHLYEEEPDLVAEYTNGLTAERQSYSMDLFQKGICRILVCTEACGMGVDVADVERVVQWGVTPRVNLSTIIQRMGRAARKSHMQGVGILFHTANSIITEKHVLAAQKYRCSSEESSEYADVQKEIMRYDLGLESVKKRNAPTSSVSQAKRLRTKNGRTQVQSSAIPEKSPGSHLKDFPSHCRATLSLINTSGCRRKVILTYFGEAPEMLQQNSACCDHCLDSNWSPELSRLIPMLPTTGEPTTGQGQGAVRPTPRADLVKRKVPPEKQQQIVEAIKMKRREIWSSLGGNKRFSPYAAGALMPEKEINSLSLKSLSITTPDHVPKILGLFSYKYISLAHQQLWSCAFDIISSILRDPFINTSDTPEMILLLPTSPKPSLQDTLPSNALKEITNNIGIATHTSTGKIRKLTKSGVPRKVRSDYGKRKKKDDNSNLQH